MKRTNETGHVYLIGAGPGDPELLTLKAVKAIAACDVLLVDDLIDTRILAHARQATRVIYAGKRGGCRSTPQAFIERMMVRFARTGVTLGRIKGGDPFVFGRGGEECIALQQAGIAYTVIPGITAGCAVPASIGIPVTHRDFSRGVTFITGHTKAGETLNYPALATAGTTLVIYMGVNRIDGIVAGLIAAGMPSNTPAAAISNGTCVTQREVITTLAVLPQTMREGAIVSPAIVVIGHVATLAKPSIHAAFEPMVTAASRWAA
jgi:uroporphyrin-III C-methyltransferase